MKRLFADEFNPVSELVTAQHIDLTPSFPVIDVHTHFGPLLLGDAYGETYDTKESCRWFRDLGIERIMCLELVWGEAYDCLCKKLDASDGMILPVGSVDVSRAKEPNFEHLVRQQILELKAKGCIALKLWKNMTLRSQEYFGENVGLDSPYYEPIWSVCAEEKLPVIIHVADPPCFFKPTNGNNEHYICLYSHPDWSFYNKGLPSFEEHMKMQENVIENHPDTTFVVAHIGSYAENLKRVSEWLDRYPNMYVDIAARCDQLGRQPYSARRFFHLYQDRILFGTDYEGHFDKEHTYWFYHTHYRFLQTEDEYFNHPFPNFLGPWKICGLGLEEQILKKVYRDNAKALFHL